MKNHDERENVIWTWSAFFWLKKLILLGLIFLAAWAVWALWQGFDGDTDLDADLPSITNPIDSVGDAVDDAADSVDDAVDNITDGNDAEAEEESSSDAGFTIARLERDGGEVVPAIDGCLHTYALTDEVSLTVADNCNDLRSLNNDFSWNHASNDEGTVIGADRPVDYCVTGTTGCSSANGVLEFSSLSDSTDDSYVDVRIVSTAAADEIETAFANYGDIISSITVER